MRTPGTTLAIPLNVGFYRFYVSEPSVKEWVVESGIHSCHFSDHDAIVLVINDTMNSPSVGSGVWKLNILFVAKRKLLKF